MDRENRKFPKKLSVCVAVLFVIVTVVSLCVMNFTPINRLLGGYKEQPLDLSRADGANITYNDDGTIRVRLRSRFLDINTLAERFHGGGHAKAAGATCYSKKEMNALIAEADTILKEYKETHENWL